MLIAQEYTLGNRYDVLLTPSERDTVPASRLCARSAHSPDQQAQESMLLNHVSSKVILEPVMLFCRSAWLSQFKSHENWSSRSQVMPFVRFDLQISEWWTYAT